MRILLKSENELTSSFRLSSFSLGNSVRDDQHLIYYFISHWGLEPRMTVNPEVSFFEGYQLKYGKLCCPWHLGRMTMHPVSRLTVHLVALSSFNFYDVFHIFLNLSVYVRRFTSTGMVRLPINY
jgi:hypothetical protein